MFYGAIGIRRSGCRHFPEHESDTSNIINKCDVRTMACRQPYSRPYTKLSYSTSASIFRGIQRLEDSLCGILVLEAEHKMPPTTVRNFFTFMEVACDFFFKKKRGPINNWVSLRGKCNLITNQSLEKFGHFISADYREKLSDRRI